MMTLENFESYVPCFYLLQKYRNRPAMREILSKFV